MAKLFLGATVTTVLNASITALAADDWAYWLSTDTSGTPSQRKAGGRSTIGNASILGTGPLTGYINDPRTLTWSDGTPTASLSTQDGIYNSVNSTGTTLTGSGYSVTFPADTTPREAILFIGGYGALAVTITASLSDRSSPTVTNTTGFVSPAAASADGLVRITYQAGSRAQTLTVSVVLASSAAFGNVALQAAAIKRVGLSYPSLRDKRFRTLAAAPVAAQYTLSIDPATYTLTPSAVTLSTGRATSFNATSYSLTASAVTLSVGRVLGASATSYALTTSQVTLSVARALSIAPASYVVSAADVTLTYTSTAKQLAIDPASYALTASAVSMSATRALSIDPASYGVTPSAITLSVGRQLNASAVSYSIAAGPVTLTTDRHVSIEPAGYIITAPDIGLTYTPAGSIDYEQLAAAVWAYTLSNGKTAEQTLVENNDMLEALSVLPNLDTPIEGAFSSSDLIRVIAAVAAGKTSVESASPGTATVEFRDVNDTETRVSAEMVGSERASVTINP